MTTELRVQMNVRVDPDMNVSMAFTHVGLDDENAIRAAGHADARAFTIYMAGWGAGATEIAEETT